MRNIVFTALIALASLSAFAEVQVVKTGKIKGVIVDQNDAVILPAKITISGKGRKWVLTPNPADGRFEAELLVGTYDIKIEAYQFRTLQQKKIQVKAETESEQKFMLQVLPSKQQKCPPRTLCL